ncbi:MAG: hypothetical protein KI786_12945 [Mameliella sp.]|nr:hypothetical protein [Phaeodactylibacter sp.]
MNKFVVALAIGTVFLSGIIPVKDRIQVNIPTAEEEAAYVWRTIADIQFFETHNYTISLPQGRLIEDLKAKAKVNALSDEDYELLVAFMETEVYDQSDYEKGFGAVMQNKDLINQMINSFDKLKKQWSYKRFEQYEVNLTLYGPGGSYDPETGSILLYTTKEGGFKQYANPSNTIIHEIIHIGTEESIMGKYQVPHQLKERIIDQLVLLSFKPLLPDYRLQHFGDARIDPFLKHKKDIAKLDEIVEQFRKDYPN